MDWRIRTANLQDCAMLWRWRNDPTTRRMQRNAAPVPWRQYESWYARALSDPHRAILIACRAGGAGGDDLGVAQFLCADTGRMAEIGLNLNWRYRGSGLAAPLINDFCAEAQRILPFHGVVAHVKAENIASRRAFARAGFALDGEADGILRFRRDFGGDCLGAIGRSRS